MCGHSRPCPKTGKSISDSLIIFLIEAIVITSHDSHVLVTTPSSSHLYLIQLSRSGCQLVQTSEDGFPDVVRNERTLLAKNLSSAAGSRATNSSLVVQITRSQVILVDMTLGTAMARWSSPSAIVAADVGQSYICLGLQLGTLVRLRIDGTELQEEQ